MATATLDQDWPEDWQRAAERGECLHCGNPLGRFWSPQDGPFCCRGCRGVYEMIHREHLDRFYDLKPDAHAPAPTLRPAERAMVYTQLRDVARNAAGRLAAGRSKSVYEAAAAGLSKRLRALTQVRE